MSLVRKDLIVPANTAQAIAFQAMNGANPFNLTGGVVTFRAALQPGAAASVQKDSTGSGITVTDAVLGQFTVNLVNTDITDSGMLHYSVDILIGGSNARYFQGRIVATAAPAAAVS